MRVSEYGVSVSDQTEKSRSGDPAGASRARWNQGC